MAQELLAARKREAAYFASQGYRGPLPEANLLAVVGGGTNGAFGAGLLTGWTEAGTRPTLQIGHGCQHWSINRTICVSRRLILGSTTSRCLYGGQTSSCRAV
jgi:hypothetical protein